MADIFISYAREDSEAARRLAAELEAREWSVFWDRRIPAGRRFAEFISEKLAAAKCVITLWSRAANASDWVQEEAEEAKKRNILVPALIERVDPPWGFRRIQAADLVDWQGEGLHEGFRQLLQDIEQYVPAHPPVGREKGSVERGTETGKPWPLETESVEAPSTGSERERAEQKRPRQKKAEAEHQAADAEGSARLAAVAASKGKAKTQPVAAPPAPGVERKATPPPFQDCSACGAKTHPRTLQNTGGYCMRCYVRRGPVAAPPAPVAVPKAAPSSFQECRACGAKTHPRTLQNTGGYCIKCYVRR